MKLQEKIIAKLGRGIGSALAIACLVVFAALIETGAVSQEPDRPQQTASRSKKDSKKEESAKEHRARDVAARTIGREIMWREPVDLERRDLFYGPGRREGAPDTSSPFTFVKHSKSGTQKKVIVKDDKGREWTVKFGPEARPETAATRIVWVVGYHVDQTYFVPQARITGAEEIDARDVRFERRDDGFKEVGNWKWKENPFIGTRELDGLKILMALLKNWDLKSTNNKVLQPKRQPDTRIYYVSDLGGSLGHTGTFLHRIPFVNDLPATWGSSSAKAKGDPESFAKEEFIEEVKDGKVSFYHRRARGHSLLKDIPVENARWMGNLLGRLSDKQLTDAFRAGGFDDDQVALYVRTIRERINQLRSIQGTGGSLATRKAR
jgi:hypothetical protein